MFGIPSPARLAPTLFFTCGLLAAPLALAAQGAPRPGGPPATGEWPPRGPDPVVVDGPPAPGEFRDLTGITEEQATKYGVLYDDLMAATRATRDSLQQFREEMRGRRDRPERDSVRPRGGGPRALVTDLEQKQRAFDERLKGLLSGAQYAKYQAWRSERRHEMRDHRRGEGPPHDGRGI